MKIKTDPRHNGRKLALASIFSWSFSDPNQDKCLELSEEFLELEKTDNKLTTSIIKGVQKNRKEIDDLIRKHAPEWPIDKIARVDLVILRIAIFELAYGKDSTPEKVAIDEAVELAKEFGNENSSKFVNGVLGSVLEEKEGKEKN